MGEYADTLREIDEIQRGDDLFKSTIQLGDLAARLAAENFRLTMTVGMLRERLAGATAFMGKLAPKEYNPYLADDRQEGMRL